jgi:Uma2 family endonuclease
MAEPAEKRWTIEEFFAWNDGTDRRYELVDGNLLAMAPASEAHGTIVANLTIAIGRQLRAPCRVVGEAGVIPADRGDTYFQADLLVTCAPPERGRPYPVDPVLIVEVLSPSTADHDRGRKVEEYSRLPSVREILLVSSEERRARTWRRDGRRWIVEDLIDDAELRLDIIPDPISLAAIHEGSGV